MAKADELKAKMGLSGPPLAHVPSGLPIVPDHEMVRRIGQGSYGEVWLARSTVGTWRAVKVVYRDHFKEARPYEREFEGIQKYEPISRTSEGLVDVLQIGRNDAKGYFYYVMELADDASPDPVPAERSLMSNAQRARSPECNQSLLMSAATYTPKTLAREIRSRGRLSIEECITLGMTLNLALGHLHREGLIHRDVKPSNIIFVNGVPKLADIGLVTDFAEAQSFVGTEGFIPPEGPNSRQGDVYALGKVLYEAAMGKDRQEFPEPYTNLGADADSKALMELNEVLLKACADKPKERYQTAEEMNADLALLHSGKSVQSKHTLERRLKATKRLAATVVAVMVLGVVPYYLAIREAHLATVAARNEAAQRRDAEAAKKAAQTEAAKSQQVAQLLKDMLKGVGPSVALGRDTQMLQEILDKTADHLSKDLGGQPAVEAELRNIIGTIYYELEENQKAEAMHREALRLRKALFGLTNELVAASLYDLGLVLARGDGKPAEAEASFSEALDIRRRLFGNQGPDVARALFYLAVVRGNRGAPEAEDMYQEALSIGIRASGENLEIAHGLTGFGDFLMEKGKQDKAESMHRKALSIRTQLLGRECSAVVESLSRLAEILAGQSRWAEMEAIGNEAIGIMEKLPMESLLDPDASPAKYLAMMLQNQGRLGDAENMFRRELAIRKRFLGEEHPAVARAIGMVWRVLAQQGKRAEVETVCREHLDRLRARVPANHFQMGAALGDLAIALLNEGRFGEAEPLAREALAIREKQRPDEWWTLSTQEVLGYCLLKLKRYPEAETVLVSSYQGMKQRAAVPPQNCEQNLWRALRGLAEVCEVTGRTNEATNWRRALYQEQATALKNKAMTNNAVALNDLAWLLATCPESEFRDGKRAVDLAETAVLATNRKDPTILDTLAAAYAEAGEFGKAVSTQQEAIALLKDDSMKNDLVTRLNLYQSNTSYQER